MRMFRSFLLRLLLMLSLNATISFGLMAATLALQGYAERVVFTSMLGGLLLLWLGINYYVVRKADPEISLETARFLYPAGIFLNLGLSWNLALYLDKLIPGTEGKQHYILYFVGIGIALFLVVRCFDIKWLRAEADFRLIEDRDS